MTIELKRPQLAASDIPDIYTQVSWPKIIQPKLDGICCLAVNGVAMSRNMKPIPNKHIQKFFNSYGLHGFHGELMFRGDFNDVQSFVMSEDKVSDDWFFVIYDYWNSNGNYSQRFTTLENLLLEFESSIHLIVVPTAVVLSPQHCEVVLEEYLEAGYEGAMLRDPDSLYKQGRQTLKSEALLKLKKFYDDEAVIIGFEEKLTNTNEKELDERGYAKRSSKKEGMVPAGTLGALVVKWKDVEFKIGSGYTDAQRQEIWNNRDDLLGKLVTFKYQELSKYGVPRFPVWKCVRDE